MWIMFNADHKNDIQLRHYNCGGGGGGGGDDDDDDDGWDNDNT